MRCVHAIVVSVAIVALGILITFAAPIFGGLTAQATPQIGKGQPCGNCHTGSPPTKKNVKR